MNLVSEHFQTPPALKQQPCILFHFCNYPEKLFGTIPLLLSRMNKFHKFGGAVGWDEGGVVVVVVVVVCACMCVCVCMYVCV